MPYHVVWLVADVLSPGVLSALINHPHVLGVEVPLPDVTMVVMHEGQRGIPDPIESDRPTRLIMLIDETSRILITDRRFIDTFPASSVVVNEELERISVADAVMVREDGGPVPYWEDDVDAGIPPGHVLSGTPVTILSRRLYVGLPDGSRVVVQPEHVRPIMNALPTYWMSATPFWSNVDLDGDPGGNFPTVDQVRPVSAARTRDGWLSAQVVTSDGFNVFIPACRLYSTVQPDQPVMVAFLREGYQRAGVLLEQGQGVIVARIEESDLAMVVYAGMLQPVPMALLEFVDNVEPVELEPVELESIPALVRVGDLEWSS